MQVIYSQNSNNNDINNENNDKDAIVDIFSAYSIPNIFNAYFFHILMYALIIKTIN